MALGSTRADSLESLEAGLGDCQRCSLGATRTRLVFGVGDPDAALMFVGEAPGKNEDLQGEPFVGAAGKLLDELLDGIGLLRSNVYIANVLKCRPPGNRDPLPDEIATCTPYLAEQMRLIDPVVVATLGNFATNFLLDTTRGITDLRGRLFHVDGRRVVPVFHPAAALYTPAKKEILAQDFQRIRRVLDDPDAFASSEHGEEASPAAPPASSRHGGSPPPAESPPASPELKLF